MRIVRSVAVFSLVALTWARAGAQVTPQALAKLEAQHTAKPGNGPVARALGIALFKLHRYPDAERALTEASIADPKDGLSALYLGMSCEEQGKLPAARAAYARYLETGKTKSAKDDVVRRMAALSQKELAADAKARVADERRLAGQPGDPRTIAVLPVRVTGDTMYVPLGRGLADLMIADFGKVAPQLTLLERDHVQSMLDEIALGRSNQVDQATVVREGHLLQANRMVTGQLTINNTNAIFTTSVVNVTTSQSASGANTNGALARIFDTEKAAVLSTLVTLGVRPTPAQTAAIQGNRPTSNLNAFLAYSRGLAASDAGRLDEAAQFFDNAHAIDPNFAAAAQRAASARAGSAGQGITTAQIDGKIKGGSEGQIVNAAEHGTLSAPGLSSLGSTIQNALADVNPSAADAIGRTTTAASNRDPASSTAAKDQATVKTGTLTIVIKRP